MIILIPLGGKGERFKHSNYTLPKGLIKVDTKEILFHLLDHLKIKDNVSCIYIPYNVEYKKHNFEDILKQRYPRYPFRFFVLEEQTRGAVETISKALRALIAGSESRVEGVQSRSAGSEPRVDIKNRFDEPIICIDSDCFYTTDILSKWDGTNTIFTFISKT